MDELVRELVAELERGTKDMRGTTALAEKPLVEDSKYTYAIMPIDVEPARALIARAKAALVFYAKGYEAASRETPQP